MSKYDPLGIYLSHQSRELIPMSFSEIEKILGRKLPSSKKHRAWWSNNPTNNVMTDQWLRAGYETEAVDIAGEKLVFRKTRDAATGENRAPRVGEHPIFGCMKGTITIGEGVDLTEPTEFAWEGKLYNE
ncbi:DUF7662 domain-containing protein [Martelella lutilitoris]|uniref:DUF7662 domain-containing protein n=1 Tax=Martelella lutilitoris TaxID=2583532 RepID=UPI001FED7909|nr:hypothetical protein [Martelella lutilitoris]